MRLRLLVEKLRLAQRQVAHVLALHDGVARSDRERAALLGSEGQYALYVGISLERLVGVAPRTSLEEFKLQFTYKDLVDLYFLKR